MNNKFITYMEIKKSSPRTIKLYTMAVEKMLSFVGKAEADITRDDMDNWAHSISKLSANTINLHLSATNAYFDFLVGEGLVASNLSRKIKRLEPNPKVKPYITAEMVTAMVDNAKNDRDRAIIYLTASSGMRVSELTSIALKQYETMKAYHSNQIIITGKGNKEGEITINPKAQQLIDKYLENRKEVDGCDKLFTSNYGGKMNTANLDKTIKNNAIRANIPFAEDMSMHCLRAACATIMVTSGVPITTVQRVLRHKNESTTALYAKTCPEQSRNAVMNIAF